MSIQSNYAKYIKEREGKSIVEDENGFATYSFQEHMVYIEDIYVIPEKRKMNVASKYADIIAEEAKKLGYNQLLGSVVPTANGATTSLKVLLGYGFKVYAASDNIIYFIKDIGENKNG